ncbi:MAG: ECF-type sigma factor [Phycisphaerales bacterium]
MSDGPIDSNENRPSGEAAAPVLRDAMTQTIYEQMRPIAASLLGNPMGSTLQPTAIVNETFIKLAGNPKLEIHDRAHLVCLAAKAMRHILADHARQRLSAKRGGGEYARVTLSDIGTDGTAHAFDAIDVHTALERLERLSERQARVVELRFFAGMSMPEIAEAMKISERTAHNDWRFAKAWLRRELGNGDDA